MKISLTPMPHKSYHKLKHTRPAKADPLLEKLALLVAIAEPLMTIPQILQIYVKHDTGSSLLTWALYLSASVIWLVYGLKKRNAPLITTAILWLVVELVVVLGIILV